MDGSKNCPIYANCTDCRSEGCFWNASARKCGETNGEGFSDHCEADLVKRYNEGLKYKNQNIVTPDNKTGYVTSTGLLKPFEANSAGGRGCPAAAERVNTLWDRLGFALGSKMVSGQSCGNEAAFIAAAPPENAFDAAWYKANYKLTSEQDAYADWVDEGQAAGRLPNENILKSMAQLGKVGYVDADTVFHQASQPTFTGFKSFVGHSNVTGAQMQDCTETIYLKYGDRVTLLCADTEGSLSSDSKLTFTEGKKTEFFVRPMDPLVPTGAEVKFGDNISLASSITNYSTSCGLWGCKVSGINPTNYTFEFGPGGGALQPFTIEPARNGHKVGESIPFDVPFHLTTTPAMPHNAMFQGRRLKPGRSIRSANEEYVLSFQSDGYLALYKDTEQIWKSEAGSPYASGLLLNASGKLQAINTNGVVYWQSDRRARGTAPYALTVQNSGQVVLYDSNKTVMWQVGTGASNTSENTKWHAVLQNSYIVFSPSASKAKAEFVFAGKKGANACNIKKLMDQCKESCVGFIHDPNKNEWQQVRVGATNYKVTDSLQDFYLKVPSTTSADARCPQTPVRFIDPSQLQNYPAGAPFDPQNTEQCAPPFELPNFEPTYPTVPVESSSFAELETTFRRIDAEQEASADKITTIDKYKKILAQPNLTLEQQETDSAVVDKQAKVHAGLWIGVAGAIFVCYLMNKYTAAGTLPVTIRVALVLLVLFLYYYAVVLYKKYIG